MASSPKTGPLVVVANHPSGLVDGMVMAEMVCRVRSDFKILTRSLLTGIPEVEEFMIPVPFPHEDNARELGLQMRDETMKHLRAGGVIILFPAGKVAMSEDWWGPAVESEWNVFTHKIVKSSGATILPVYFPGQNSRAFLIANKISDTLRQGLLLYEIKRCLFKPTRPVIGAPIPAEELKKWEGNPRGFLAWLRQHTLEAALRTAVKGDCMRLHYQPIVDMKTGLVTHAEVLVRWNHPTRGRLSAGEFLPFAEENGLMLPISDWMIGALCRDIALKNGLILRATYDSMLLSPPLVISRDQVDELAEKAWKALDLTARELGMATG